jgi:hypothetical protein
MVSECEDCGGRGCLAPRRCKRADCTGCRHRCLSCGGSGRVRIERCPMGGLGEGVWAILQAADLAERGLWPVRGGADDQAAVFLEAALRVWRETAYWRAELGLDVRR